MFEVGRVCMKTAGRDSNKVCAIVEVVDNQYVLIDGNVRRRKVNVNHIEPTQKTIKISKGAATTAVTKALEEAGFKIDKKGDKRQAKARPKKAKLEKTPVVEKPAKESTKKPETPTKKEEPQVSDE